MIDVIVGAQFGSEAKGAVACALAQTKRYDVLVRVAGPNAGHTGYDADGRKWALRQIPVAAIWAPNATVYIGPGSEVDIDVVRQEVELLDAAGFEISDRLYIDPQASIVCAEHKYREAALQMHETMGSTGKGIGACRAERIMRKGPIAGDLAVKSNLPGQIQPLGLLDSTGYDYMIEGTQGYGLGLHAGYYPHCTSSDCRAVDFLAMAGAGMGHIINTWVVARTHPIRVAGPSGELPFETSWEELGEETHGHIQPERTTVTQKIRRVARFDPDIVRKALAENAPPGTSNAPQGTTNLALTFWDYIEPAHYQVQEGQLLAREVDLRATDWCHKWDLPTPSIITTGPANWVIPAYHG